MGGNALKNVQTRRVGREEYSQIYSELYEQLFLKYRLFSKFEILRNYSDKDSFGDMDILVCDNIDEFTKGRLVGCLSPYESKEIIQNGPVTSFEYKNFQIDLVFVPRESFEYAYEYFYGDLGNLVGKLAHQVGLRHTHKGLFLRAKDGTKVISDICVSTDIEDTYKFLGVDRDFSKEFKTMNDMFELVSSSKYFNPDKYLFENLNHTARVRDKKRPMYNAFLEYCKTYTGPKYISKSKVENLKNIFKSFPDTEYKFNMVMKDYAFDTVYKQKFNGNIVNELTGFVREDLGKYMVYIKSILSKEVVVYLPQEEINQIIIDSLPDFSRNNLKETQ